MRWTKTPLTDDDFAQIRRNVMAQIETPRRTSLALRFAFAALIAVCAYMIWRPRVAPEAPVHVQVVQTPRNADVPVGRSAGFQPAPAPARRPEVGGPADRRSAFPKREAIAEVPQPPQPPPMRIEIQTSDPDVRIIWIANQTQETEEESSS